MISEDQVLDLLCIELPPMRLKVEAKLLTAIYHSWSFDRKREISQASSSTDFTYQLYFQLIRHIDDTLLKLDQNQDHLEAFQVHWDDAERDEDKHELLFRAARDLGASASKLQGDKKALHRWFSAPSIIDRYRKFSQQKIRELRILLEQTGKIAGKYLELKSDTWMTLQLEERLQPYITYLPDVRVRIAAFQALARAIQSLPSDQREGSLSEPGLRYIYRTALASRQDIWLQISALELLPQLSPDSLIKVVEKRLFNYREGDDIFFRHRAIHTLTPLTHRHSGALDLLYRTLQDPSEHVRIAIANNLHHIPLKNRVDFSNQLLRKDPSHRVRSSALLNLTFWTQKKSSISIVSKFILQRLHKERDPFTTRVLLKVIADLSNSLMSTHNQGEQWFQLIAQQLQIWTLQQTSPEYRRWASQTLLTCWSNQSTDRYQWKLECSKFIHSLKPKRVKKFKPSVQLEKSEAHLLFSLVIQNNHSIEIKPSGKNWKISRGQRFCFKWWRTLYELNLASPDKREGHPHTIARNYLYSTQLPSFLLAEMSETKVPGEPLFIPEESGWRPYLPLPDLALDTLTKNWFGGRYQVITPDGITTITPTWNPFKRLYCAIKLSFTLPKIAPLRNWTSSSQLAANHYLKKLSSFGLSFKFTAHDYGFGELKDSNIDKFFDLKSPLSSDRQSEDK